MRASERKGAWALMAGIVLLGFMLWIFGKCQGSADSNGSKGEVGSFKIEMNTLPTDSAAADTIGNENALEVKSRKKRKGEKEKASVKQKKGCRQSEPKIPVRDILADTIPTE